MKYIRMTLTKALFNRVGGTVEGTERVMLIPIIPNDQFVLEPAGDQYSIKHAIITGCDQNDQNAIRWMIRMLLTHATSLQLHDIAVVETWYDGATRWALAHRYSQNWQGQSSFYAGIIAVCRNQRQQSKGRKHAPRLYV